MTSLGVAGIGFGQGQPETPAQGWTLVAEETVTTDETNHDITIDGDTSGALYFVCSIVDGATSARDYSLRLNGATAAANNQHIQGFTTTLATNTSSGGLLSNALGMANTQTIIDVTFPAPKKSIGERMLFARSKFGTTANGMQLRLLQLTTPADSVAITSIGVNSSVTDGIGVGSTFQLWKSTAD